MDNLLLKLHFAQISVIEYFNDVKLADRANFKMSLVLLKSLGLTSGQPHVNLTK